jgi:DNA-binding NtrC family response regulator
MPTKKRLLCISYDESLLTTRKMILERAGFDVTPAFGSAEASRICSFDPMFDLIVMGHSIPRADKAALVGMLRSNCKAPVLSIRRHLDQPLPEADFSVDSQEGPDALVEAVQTAVEQKTKSDL